MIRFLAFLTFFFLFVSTVEAGYWLAGRWFVSSRYASLTLGVVKSWLDRGIITSTTQSVKVFIQRHGKWILLTLGLSEVIRELERAQASGSACYLSQRDPQFDWVRCYVGSPSNYFCYGTSSTREYFSMSPEIVGGAVCGIEERVPAYSVYVWEPQYNRWRRLVDRVPVQGRHFLGRTSGGQECYINVSLNIPACPFSSRDIHVYGYPPSAVNLQERRQVPVRVYPNPLDFLRPEVVESDPALRYLRDEYQRIASDSSIPTIPSDLLQGVELPQVDWSIPEEEIIDETSQSSRSAQQEQEGERQQEGDISIPGLDTSLPKPQKRPFPVELINSLIQNHPLLRILQGITFEASGFGSCQVGSGVFTIDFCNYGWVLNLMGAIIVPISFLVGLFGWRND